MERKHRRPDKAGAPNSPKLVLCLYMYIYTLGSTVGSLHLLWSPEVRPRLYRPREPSTSRAAEVKEEQNGPRATSRRARRRD